MTDDLPHRVRIYLDIDGVINAVTPNFSTLPGATGWTKWSTADVTAADGTWRITYAPELVERINELASRENVEIRWLTTWRDHARTALAPAVGIEGTEWLVTPETEPRKMSDYGWWKWNAFKIDAVNEAADDPVRKVWIDDDHQYFNVLTHDEWETFKDDTLIISPEMRVGLTRAHLDQIEEFIARP